MVRFFSRAIELVCLDAADELPGGQVAALDVKLLPPGVCATDQVLPRFDGHFPQLPAHFLDLPKKVGSRACWQRGKALTEKERMGPLEAGRHRQEGEMAYHRLHLRETFLDRFEAFWVDF